MATLLLVAVAAACAIVMFVVANSYPDALWHGVYHDRNGHYAFGQELALAVRTGDPVWFFRALESAKVWPPLHGLVLAVVLLLGGIDHRLGIIPSLIGWALTVVFAGAIARRLFFDRASGLVAAALTATLTIASPGFRLLACDVMLECLGSALTAAALWAYLRAKEQQAIHDAAPANAQEDTECKLAGCWRLLAIILTLLFFEKGNYWGLTVGSLAIAAVAEAPRRWIAEAREIAQRLDFRFARRLTRDPWVLAAAGLAAIIIAIYQGGPSKVTLFGQVVSLYPPENLVTVAYAVVFVRIAVGWRSMRGDLDRSLRPAGRALLYWHAVPVAVSFLLPKRLTSFLWFVGPSNASPGTAFDLLGGVRVYWQAFVDGFCPAPWVGSLAIALFVFALVRVRSMRPGAIAVFALALMSFVAVVAHPQHQPRFLASWVFAVWIGAGAGAAMLISRLMRAQPRLIAAAASAIVAALAFTGWRPPSPTAYAATIHPRGGESDLDLVRPVLPDLLSSFPPDLGRASHLAYAATFGESELFRWFIREQCHCKAEIDKPWISGLATREQVREAMHSRLASSDAPVFLVVDAPDKVGELAALGWTHDRMAGIMDAMLAQDRYVRVAAHAIEGGEVSVWRLRLPARRDIHASWTGQGGAAK